MENRSLGAAGVACYTTQTEPDVEVVGAANRWAPGACAIKGVVKVNGRSSEGEDQAAGERGRGCERRYNGRDRASEESTGHRTSGIVLVMVERKHLEVTKLSLTLDNSAGGESLAFLLSSSGPRHST